MSGRGEGEVGTARGEQAARAREVGRGEGEGGDRGRGRRRPPGSREEDAATGVEGEDRKSTRLNSSHITRSRMPSSA